MRKVIQITANSEGYNTAAHVFALCDDGTMWGYAIVKGERAWTLMPPIPQPDMKESDDGVA